ncbi:MAG: terminase family protein [Chloroflexota bacterium]
MDSKPILRSNDITHPCLTDRAVFLFHYLDLADASGVDDARWEHFQLAHLCDDSVLRIEDKSRQIAWSFLTAAEAIATAVLEKRDSIFVSINLEEAKEKIRYAKYVYQALKCKGKPILIRDASQNIEFDNGVRLTSLPARPPRGRARSNVYLDEFAHVNDAEEIYKAAMPIISKGGRLRIGSSPFGATGKFWEIFTQTMQPYPGFRRKKTPWWEAWAFCTNVPQARIQCPRMTAADAVAVFGNERIQLIFENMILEDFEQEYACSFSSLSSAWFTHDEIKAVQDPNLVHERAICRNKDFSQAISAILNLSRHLDRGKVETTFALGMDIGRTRDATDIALIGLSNTIESYPLRLSITLQNVEFDHQFEVLVQCMTQLPIVRAFIDRTGLGRQLAENAAKHFPEKAFGIDFTTASKVLWATDAKKWMQQGKTPIPVDRDLAYQLNAIKRINTGTILRFDADRSDKGHADRAFAWMLALAAAKQLRFAEPESQIRSISTMNYG